MSAFWRVPRILFVTPEVAYLPAGVYDGPCRVSAGVGALADRSAELISELYRQGADIHVALPDYRALFNGRLPPFVDRRINHVAGERVHLAHDRALYYLNRIRSVADHENVTASLAFQREVIYQIIPRVQPDIIHCSDWRTGLIPSAAKFLKIPSLFTVHDEFTGKATLAEIEERGVDGTSFWRFLFYESFPGDYKNIRASVPVDFLGSGVHAAQYVTTTSPQIVKALDQESHCAALDPLKRELVHKRDTGRILGIPALAHHAYDPADDDALSFNYSSENHTFGKRNNKRALQKKVGLKEDMRAPMLYWPLRSTSLASGPARR